MNKALLSSKNMCWCTPQDFFDKLNEEFSFTLDAAATDKTAKCPLYFTPETDGLKSSWKVAGGGTVFCNPPYGREIGKWVQKAYEEAQAGTPIVLLIPARTDTSYSTILYTTKRKFALFVGGFGLRTTTATPPIPRPSPLCW